MYNNHALIDAQSAHMIHINLNKIFYTHVEHSSANTIYIKYYLKERQQQQQEKNKKKQNESKVNESKFKPFIHT